VKELNHRYEQVVVARSVDEPTKLDDMCACLYNILRGITNAETAVAAAVQRAYESYTKAYKREAMEALLLSGATPQEIYSCVKVDPETTRAYSHLFFDTLTFDDELDKVHYAYNYSLTEYGKELKKYAISAGKTGLMIKLSRGECDAKSDEIERNIRTTAYMLAKEAVRNPLDSAKTKEAYRWASLGLNAVQKDVRDQDNIFDNIRLELEKIDDTKTDQASDIPVEEFLH